MVSHVCKLAVAPGRCYYTS